MNEAEWLAATDPEPMLAFLRRQAGDRKLRLFAAACCRRIWDRITDPRCRRAIEIAEQHADGGTTDEVLGMAAEAAWVASRELANARPSQQQLSESFAANAAYKTTADPRRYARMANDSVRLVMFWLAVLGPAEQASEDYLFEHGLHTMHRIPPPQARTIAANQEGIHQIQFLRDIFGNPFRPVPFSPNWRTDSATTLAGQMYESRDFGAMPILADALQDAGCDSEDVLNHCRGGSVHIRGCWVVDLVLGKE